MALSDTGQSDEEIARNQERQTEDISRQFRPTGDTGFTMPGLPESISPMSPAAQAIRVAQADSTTATDATATNGAALPTPQMPSWLDSIMDTPWSKRSEWTQAAEQAVNAEIADEQQKTKDKARSAAHAPRDAQLMSLPQPQPAAQLPTSPIGDFRNTLSSFATPLMILGAVASMGGRRRSLNAMNALGGLFKGMAAGNAELARLNYQKFHGSVNGLIAETESHNMQYNEIFNDPNRSDANKLADAHALAAGLEDRSMMGYTSKGDLAGAQALVQGRTKTVEDLITKRSRATRGGGTMAAERGSKLAAEMDPENLEAIYQGKSSTKDPRVVNAVRALHPDFDASKMKTGKLGTAAQQRLDVQQKMGESQANGIEKGLLPPTFTGVSGQMARGILADRGVNVTDLQVDWERIKKEVSALNSSQMQRFDGLARGVVHTIDRVKQLAAEREQGGFTPLNALELKTLMNTRGNTPEGQLATRYVTAVGDLKELFASLVQGGYTPTEPAWQLANVQINGNYGQQQLEASLDEIQRLINIRRTNIGHLMQLGPSAPNRYLPGGAQPQQTTTAPAATPLPTKFDQTTTGTIPGVSGQRKIGIAGGKIYDLGPAGQ